MAKNFKQQAAQKRAGVPQVDLEDVKPTIPTPVSPPKPSAGPAKQPAPAPSPEPAARKFPITPVDTNEMPTNRGFSMYPSRHRQIAKDLPYIEDRKPWQIIDDAIEEYVVRHYGKEFKRK